MAKTEDEWTFVSHSTASKGKHRRRHDAKGGANNKSNKSSSTNKSLNVGRNGDMGGLYRVSLEDGTSGDDATNFFAKAWIPSKKQHQEDNDDDDDDEAKYSKEEKKSRIQKDVLECMHELDHQVRSGEEGDGFAFRLIRALKSSIMSSLACTSNGNEDDDIIAASSSSSLLNLREIVAYGIGNFANQSSFSASMLQLACLLLLRRHAAQTSLAANLHDGNDDDNDHEANKNTAILDSSVFQNEQRQVPIFYYEPCILPIEKQLLESTFHIHVLETNHLGKLTVECMRQQFLEGHNASTSSPLALSNEIINPTRTTSESTTNTTTQCHTLFYMPHCPMRLYCNVLWAHWDHLTDSALSIETIIPKNAASPVTQTTIMSPQTLAASPPPAVEAQKLPKETNNDSKTSFTDNNNPIILFGNSFHSYEERTISSEQLTDPTNGIFQVLPLAREIPLRSSCSSSNSARGSNKKGEDCWGNLRNLEMAFNDCSVISFALEDTSTNCDDDNAGGGIIRGVRRPKEYFPSEDPNENGELM